MNKNLYEICRKIPKAELHIHIEGTLEPEMIMELSKRNNIPIPYNSVEEIKEKNKFNNLKEFIDVYMSTCKILKFEEDFYDLMLAYLKKEHEEGLKYAEISFDPITHLKNGVEFSVFMKGFNSAMKKAEVDLEIESKLILTFKRDSSIEESKNILKLALPFKSFIIGVGLASCEIGYPPELFTEVFKEAKTYGFRLCCHAGEEGGPENIRQCINLGIERIDHGVRIIEDEELMDIYVEKQIPLTLCPLSNYKLKVYPDLTKYPLKTLMQKGLLVMLNSDDPAYFGGYLGDNYIAMVDNCNINLEEIILLAKNSFKASFLEKEKIDFYLNSIDKFINKIKIS